MIPPIATRLPLVRRPKAPALPLQGRINHLAGLAEEPAGASHHDRVARACGVLNFAALIASDVAMPELAAELCWRQHRVFAATGRLTGDIAVMALMPLINVSRLLTREGDGEGAYTVLTRLYRAAQQRTTTRIHGHTVDVAALTTTESDHHKLCQELWVTVLIDGARALARIGRWTQAADTMAAHRGVGHRLLDGRQILIMSLMERGLHDQARETIDATIPTEPWEHAIAALLRASCHTQDDLAPPDELDDALTQATKVLNSPDPATALFQTRVGLAALDLPRDHNAPHPTRLHDVLTDAAGLDAYAARDLLNHPTTAADLGDEQRRHLEAVLTTAGLGAGTLPHLHMEALTSAVEQAEATLRGLLP